jgi:hypothetical protein
MLKFVLIVMLVSNQTGEITHVQQPRGYVTKEQCYEGAKNFKTKLSGYHVQFACLEGLGYEST